MIIKKRWWQRRYEWIRKGNGYFDREGRRRRCMRSGLRSTFYFQEFL